MAGLRFSPAGTLPVSGPIVFAVLALGLFAAVNENAGRHGQNRREQRDQQEQFGDHRDPRTLNTGSPRTLHGITLPAAAPSGIHKLVPVSASSMSNIFRRQGQSKW